MLQHTINTNVNSSIITQNINVNNEFVWNQIERSAECKENSMQLHVDDIINLKNSCQEMMNDIANFSCIQSKELSIDMDEFAVISNELDEYTLFILSFYIHYLSRIDTLLRN